MVAAQDNRQDTQCEPLDDASKSDSYGQVLRSSALIGGAQAILYAVGFLRTKVAAVLLGPEGVGTVALYQANLGLLATLAGLGISQSGVREVAAAHAAGDAHAIARTVLTLRRACWLTGVVGWALVAWLAEDVSRWIFGNSEHAGTIAILGSTLLLGAVSGGQTAVLQGMRRIGDLARLRVASGVLSTLLAIGCYVWLGVDGIVPALLVAAVVQLGCSYWYAQRIKINAVDLPIAESLTISRGLLELGVVLMYSGLLTAITDVLIRRMIVADLGLEASGVYQAAWAISGMFAAFILSAMGSDYYPRLTAVASDNGAFNRIVNEQTEVGVLLALPGIVATLTLAPLLMTVLYSRQFLPAAELLPWFALGVFGRVVSWPLAFTLLAKHASRQFALLETSFCALHLFLCYCLLGSSGLAGAAYAFSMLYAAYLGATLCIASTLSGFRWSRSTLGLLATASKWLIAAFAVLWLLQGLASTLAGLILSSAASLACIRGLATRLGPGHQLVRRLSSLPGGRLALGI